MMVEDDIVVAVTYNPEKDRFLLLKRDDSADVFPGCWDLPGGHLVEDESTRKGVLRELKEETGLLGEIIVTGEPHVVDSKYGEYRLHPFLVRVDSVDIDLSEEHVDHRWVNAGELEDMETVKAMERDFEAVGVMDE